MTIHYEIEYQTPEEEIGLIQVDLLGEVTVEDFPIVEEIEWCKDEHSPEENKIIGNHVRDNYSEIEKKFIKKHTNGNL